MNQSNEHIQPAIDSDPIAHILSTEEAILPSSGFLASVMDRVQEESRVPARLPFPWKRALPGFVLAGGVFGWGAYEFARMGIAANYSFDSASAQMPTVASGSIEQAAWVAFSLVVSFLSWRLSCRLSGQS